MPTFSIHLSGEALVDNRTRFLQLLETYDIKQKRSAELIGAVTNRPCSDRTVRSWINDPKTKNAHPCPDWALTALETAIHYMQVGAQRHAERLKAAETNHDEITKALP